MGRFSWLQTSTTKPIVIATTWIFTVVGLALWISSLQEGTLRDYLRRWQFWSLETQFLLLVSLSVITLRHLLKSLQLSTKDYVFPAIASALTLVLVLAVAPRTNRIYYDEQIYQSIGQNFADLRLAQMCNDGTVEYGSLQCWRGEYNKEPYGYPYLISVAFRLFGVGESVAPAMNGVAAALMVWVVFLIATAMSGRVQAGQYAALVAALIPEQLRWSHTAAAEPTAALACAVAVLAAVVFARERRTTALLWMVSTAVFAAQLRLEGVLTVGIALLIVLMFAPQELRRPRIWWIALGGLVMSTPHLMHMLAVRHEGWGTAGPRFSWIFLPSNLEVNGGFFLGDPRFPVVYSALAVAGLLLFKPRRTMAALLTYFACFWGIFLFFYAGSYNYGADDRFSLMAYPAVALIAGLGAWALVDRLSRVPALAAAPLRALLIVALLVQFTWYLPFVRAVGEEAWGARADVNFARSFIRDLPPNAYVLTQNPNMFHLWGVNAGQASLATGEPAYLTDVLGTRYAGGVYFHWNFWCNVADPVQQTFCSGILDRFQHTLIREYRERNYRYAVYRLVIPPKSNER